MKRPVFSFRPNRKDRNHRKAWSILEKVPEGEKSQFLVDAILFYDQADALEQLIRKSVREELKCGDMRQTVATAEPEELPPLLPPQLDSRPAAQAPAAARPLALRN